MTITSTERVRQWRIERRAKGICRDCRNPVVPGSAFCQACRDRNAKHRREKAEANPAFHMYWNRRGYARAEGIPFTITIDDIVIPEYCPILGIKLTPGCKTIHDASPTLDRIIPEKGYVPGNIVVMSRRANRLKNNARLDELVALGRWAANVSGLRTPES